MSGYSDKRAVALKYTKDNSAPVVVASGMGYMAEKILEIANKNEIAVHEDASLATLLSRLEVGQEIPDELYGAIVDIYVFLATLSEEK